MAGERSFSQISPKRIFGSVWYLNTLPLTSGPNLWLTYHIAVCVMLGDYTWKITQSRRVMLTHSKESVPPPAPPHQTPSQTIPNHNYFSPFSPSLSFLFSRYLLASLITLVSLPISPITVLYMRMFCWCVCIDIIINKEYGTLPWRQDVFHIDNNHWTTTTTAGWLAIRPLTTGLPIAFMVVWPTLVFMSTHNSNCIK